MPALASHIPPLFSSIPQLFSFLVIISLAFFARLIHVLPYFTRRSPCTSNNKPSHVLIVLGSGGHTAEMLSMIRNLDQNKYNRRTYIVSSGDQFSAEKAVEFEKELGSKLLAEPEGTVLGDDTGKVKSEIDISKSGVTECSYRVVVVSRARNIHQPLYTTPISSLISLWSCIQALLPQNENGSSPDLILTNGPATGVIIVLAGLIIRFLGLEGQGEMRSIYIESWARVKTLSLSGKILDYGLVDRFLVQWKGLRGAGREYKGVLVE